MEIEVAVTTYKMVEIEKALDGMIPWGFHIVTGEHAEKYYLAERDDRFLEVSQESLDSDGSLHASILFYLSCPGLPDKCNSHDVLAYVKANLERVINYKDVWEYE